MGGIGISCYRSWCFPYATVPQASTGFSPLGLLYSRRFRWLLDVAKEAWEQQLSPHCTLMEHVKDLRERMVKLSILYRIPETCREVVKTEGQNMLTAGIIDELRSEWDSPKVLILKPDGTVRICNDFQKWNGISRFDAYPMPSVDELIERLGGIVRFISTLILTKGY